MLPNESNVKSKMGMHEGEFQTNTFRPFLSEIYRQFGDGWDSHLRRKIRTLSKEPAKSVNAAYRQMVTRKIAISIAPGK
jgi:hypothetical protein